MKGAELFEKKETKAAKRSRENEIEENGEFLSHSKKSIS
jgi:hypothetical protein